MITIVTAFFDIGRGEWTQDKGFPQYLQRTTDTYIERFSRLTQLENDIVVITSDDIIEKLIPLNTKNNIKFFSVDRSSFKNMRDHIEKVQQNPNFQQMINSSQRINPEYWNPDYVLINFLKSTFVDMVISTGIVKTDLVAWLDFGYCRSDDKIPKSKKWSYNFDVNKMHLFNYMEYDGKDIKDITANNIVYILGAKIVGGQEAWHKFADLMNVQLMKLLQQGMVDDDQTLMLMCTIDNPDLFELHRIPDHQQGHDPFVIFEKFNSEA